MVGRGKISDGLKREAGRRRRRGALYFRNGKEEMGCFSARGKRKFHRPPKLYLYIYVYLRPSVNFRIIIVIQIGTRRRIAIESALPLRMRACEASSLGHGSWCGKEDRGWLEQMRRDFKSGAVPSKIVSAIRERR